ncbi:hypothetical protein BH11PSE11_BH11PSE11_12240 [soil metagenome]
MEGELDIGALMKSIIDDELSFGPIELSESLYEITLIMGVLEADISPILEMKPEDHSGPQRRSLVRAIFALIEGITYGIKQTALELDNKLERRLTEVERMAISETAASIGSKGQVEINSVYPKVKNNVLFAFNMLGKATGSAYQLEIGVVGWEAFQKSLLVRDRITHPKQASDLAISDPEIEVLKAAFWWFHKAMLVAMFSGLQGMLKMKYPN